MSQFTIDDLAGRNAACGCGKAMPSIEATAQPFFQFRGPGTADDICAICHYAKIAHEYESNRVSPEPVRATRDHAFAPMVDGYATDAFYCGDFRVHPAGLD